MGTRTLRAALALAAALAVTGCRPDIPAADPAGMADACGAADLQHLVGQPASVLETMKFSQPVRILRPGMAVTMDYRPDRLNIEIDAQEVIARVHCV